MSHEILGVGKKDVNHPADEFNMPIPQRIGPNHGSYSNSHTLDFPVRTNGRGGLMQRLRSDAYIRVVVNGDMSWKVPSISIFVQGELPYGQLPD